jgi:hypothetical protein
MLKVLDHCLLTASLPGNYAPAGFFEDQPRQLGVLNPGCVKCQRNVAGQVSQVRVNTVQGPQSVELSSSDG